MIEKFTRLAKRQVRTRFHVALSIAFLVTAFAGFAPSYFLRTLSHRPSLGPLLHIHGAVFTAWLVLLVVQTSLVRMRRVAIHRTLGIAGAVLAAVMVPSGAIVAVEQARHHLLAGTRPDPLGFLAVQLSAVVIFGALIAVAVWKRKRAEFHRRAIVLATTSLMAPAIARMPFVGLNAPLALGLSVLFVVAAGLNDWREGGRVHHLYVVGGIALLLSGPLRIAVGHTEAWHAFARMLVG